MAAKFSNPQTGDGASPGKIFIGGLAKDTTYATFNKHFGKYGEITDCVIMKDRNTGQPRGFGFITYADPVVVDKVIEDTHVINGKQVEIKRTIPKGSNHSKDFKTKKIFVGGIPSTVNEDELKNFFSTHGNVVEHQIIRDHETNRSRGFGFVIFDSDEVVDEILSKGNMIDMAGTQVEIKKAEPKKPSNPPPPHSYGSNPRARSSFNDGGYGGFGGSYGGYEGGFGAGGPYRTPGGLGSRLGAGGGYGGEFASGGYGGYGGYRGESSLGYGSSGRFGPYGGGFGGGGGGGSYGGGSLGGYGRGGGEGGYGSYGGSTYGGGYESGPGASYGGGGGGSGGGGSLYGGRGGGYSGSSRYHPYTR
ncbi:hypothetical protein ACFE04_006110 [Oxalis oulophora]